MTDFEPIAIDIVEVAVDILKDYAENDPTDEVRQAAIDALDAVSNFIETWFRADEL